jgi:hypothetical protein
MCVLLLVTGSLRVPNGMACTTICVPPSEATVNNPFKTTRNTMVHLAAFHTAFLADEQRIHLPQSRGGRVGPPLRVGLRSETQVPRSLRKLRQEKLTARSNQRECNRLLVLVVHSCYVRL